MSVPGEGAENAEIMFIGEAPGWNETSKVALSSARQANSSMSCWLHQTETVAGFTSPTSSSAGRRVTATRSRPKSQTASTGWINQIELISPKIIVTLGRYSMAKFFPGKPSAKIHGTAQTRDGIMYFAMYHPAAALHQGKPAQNPERRYAETAAAARSGKNS